MKAFEKLEVTLHAFLSAASDQMGYQFYTLATSSLSRVPQVPSG